jgi:hypothetical protein
LNPQGRRRFTAAQIKAGFGGKRRQAALKGKRRKPSSHKHRAASSVNPKRSRKPKRRVSAKAKNPVRTKVVYRTKYKTRTKKVFVDRPRKKANAKRRKSRKSSSANPYLMTLSPVVGNPHKKRRKKTMAKPKRKVSAKRSGHRKSSNPRRRSRRGASHRPARRSSNPFGQPTSRIAKVGFGVFIGASTTKKLPQFYPAQLTATPAMAVLSTLATAAALAWGANQLRFTRGDFAEGVLWGGIAQTINVAWNAFAPPPFAQYATLGHLGDFTPGQFPLPNGPVRFIEAAAPDMTPSGQNVNVGAFGAAW